MTERNRRRNMKTHCTGLGTARMVGNMVYPGEYVSVQLTEAIFKTHKSYFYCLSRTRQDEVDSRGGVISKLTLPDADLRKYKAEMIRELFGKDGSYGLDTTDRLRLARAMRSRYNSSPKQIARIVGLKFDEIRDLF